MIVVAYFFNKYIDKETLQTIVKNTGQLGILIYGLLEIIYVTFTPLLNTFVLIASGYIFGGNLGFVINFISTTIGLFLIVVLVKKYGRPLLQRLVSPRFYGHFDKITKQIGPITLFIVYVLPFTPDDELTYIIAAGAIKLRRFILPIILGTIAKAAYSYIGDQGTHGIAIAAYFRIIILIVGLVIIGLQEYVIKKIKLHTK
jgi:uncharacterized membrane protein YdjX (TVP38/TMEM64 family)